MKLWIDDVREAPEGYIWCKSVNETIEFIEEEEAFFELTDQEGKPFSLLDLDHDAGEYASDGGDYIKLLDWLEETGRSYPIRIHSMNPVGVENMRQIIVKNNWREVK